MKKRRILRKTNQHKRQPFPGQTDKDKKISASFLSRACHGWMGFLSGIATIFTIISGIYLFLPKIQIIPNESLNPQNPFSAQFTIANQSIFSLYSVQPYYKFNKVDYGNYNRLVDSYAYIEESIVKEVKSNESSTVSCITPVYAGEILSADVNVCVNYRASFIPFTQYKCLRFYTEKTYDGKFVWYTKALENP